MKKIVFLICILSKIIVAFTNVVSDREIIEKNGKMYLKSDLTLFSGMVVDDRDRYFYTNGVPNGKWLTFYQNGNLKSIENWRDGKLNGKYIIYLKNGTKSLETFFTEGKDDGNYYIYNENGTIKIEGCFIKGKPAGHWKYFDRNGKLLKTATYPSEQSQ